MILLGIDDGVFRCHMMLPDSLCFLRSHKNIFFSIINAKGTTNIFFPYDFKRYISFISYHYSEFIPNIQLKKLSTSICYYRVQISFCISFSRYSTVMVANKMNRELVIWPSSRHKGCHSITPSRYSNILRRLKGCSSALEWAQSWPYLHGGNVFGIKKRRIYLI